MILTLDTNSKIFRHVFVGTALTLSAVCFTVAAYSWTGPTSSPPGNNVAAPVNVSVDSQVKEGPLSVGGLSVYGNQYITGNVGVGTSPGSSWKIDARGGTYGIYADATSGQAIRGNSSGSYGGYFTSDYRGLYAAGPDAYALLGYSSYGVYTPDRVRANAGFCIGSSCITSWPSVGGSTWSSSFIGGGGGGGPYTRDCPNGYAVTGIQVHSGVYIDSIRVRCQKVD